MSRNVNRLLAVMLSLLLAVSLGACGQKSPEKKESEFRTPKIFEDITEKTGIHMAVVLENDGEEVELELYRRKDNLYVDYAEEDSRVIIITDGEIMTVLDPSSKTGVQAEADDDAQKQLDTISENVENIYKVADADLDWKKGTVKQDGMEYESEEVENKKQKTKFLYNDDEELVYVISETDDGESVMRIKALDSDIPKDIFDIPDDYDLGGDSDPEPTGGTGGKATGSGTVRIPTPSGNEVTFTNQDHGYQFKVDSAYATKQEDYNMYVYTYKENQTPYFSLFLMQNSSGQTAQQLLTGVGNNKIKDLGDRLVTGPITNTVQVGSRKVDGLEWIYKSEDGSKQYVGVQYAEIIGNFFYIWTATYEKGDTETPKAMERAMETFEMLAT